MTNLSEDIQCAGSNTRPPMLDRTDFASWQQRIRLYCWGKKNGVNILKSIDEGLFQMGTFWETLAEGNEGALHLGPERAQVYYDLSPEDKERFVTAVKLNRGLRDSNYDQLYAYLKQHEAHATENKMILEHFTQPNVDPLALMYNVSHQQYYSQASTTPPSTHAQPHFADNTQLDSRLSLTDNLIENLTNTLALLTQSYKTYLPQTNNQLRTSLNTRNQATVQDGRVVVQNVQGRQNRGRGTMQGGELGALRLFVEKEQLLFIQVDKTNFSDEDCTMFMANLSSADPVYDKASPSCDSDILSEVPDHDNYQDAIYEHHEAHEMHDYVQLNYVVDSHTDYTSDSNMIPYDQYVKDNTVPVVQSGQDNVFDEDVDEQPVQDLALNVDNVFQADDCDAFDSNVDEAPTSQTMFIANLLSTNPIYDEACPSYDSDILSEVPDHDNYQDVVCEHHEVHEMHDDVQPNYVVDSHNDYASDSNMIPYD
ncbi:hypothetical protein Tco_0383177 [Tanacetum coccineum]